MRRLALGYLGAAAARRAAPAKVQAPAMPAGTPTTVATAASPAAAAPSSVAAIIAQICPQGITAGNCGCTVDTANVQTLFENSISSLYLMWPPPDPAWANCSGIQQPSGLQTASKAIGGAAPVAGAVATAIPAIAAAAGPIGLAVGAAALITGLFAAHHAAAVAAQNNALCISVPEFNSVLQQIDAGQIAASASAYQALLNSFATDMKAGTSYKKCDALYAYNLAAQMVIAARTANLAAGTGGGTGLTASVAGLPLWMWLLGGGAAAFLL